MTLSQVLPNGQVGVNACLSNNLHGINIEDKYLVAVQRLLLLIDEWKEFDMLSHIKECLESQMNMISFILLIFMHLDQLSILADLKIFLEDYFIATE